MRHRKQRTFSQPLPFPMTSIKQLFFPNSTFHPLQYHTVEFDPYKIHTLSLAVVYGLGILPVANTHGKIAGRNSRARFCGEIRSLEHQGQNSSQRAFKQRKVRRRLLQCCPRFLFSPGQ